MREVQLIDSTQLLLLGMHYTLGEFYSKSSMLSSQITFSSKGTNAHSRRQRPKTNDNERRKKKNLVLLKFGLKPSTLCSLELKTTEWIVIGCQPSVIDLVTR